MKLLQTKEKINVEFYSSEDELSILRYTKLQKYLALEAGVGSDIKAISTRCDRIDAFIEENKLNDAKEEVNNLKLACLSVVNGVGYYTLAFACLVATVGGQVADDLTESGLLTTVEKLHKLSLTQSEIKEIVDDVKKKIDDSINIFYPNISNTTSQLIYNSKMKSYILNLCYAYMEDKIDEDEVEQLKHDYNWFSTNESPKSFRENDPENILITIEKNFFTLCSVMEENGTANPQSYSVIRFYGKLDYLNSQYQKQDAATKQ